MKFRGMEFELTRQVQCYQISEERSVRGPSPKRIHGLAHHCGAVTLPVLGYVTCAGYHLPSTGRRREHPGIVVSELVISSTEPKKDLVSHMHIFSNTSYYLK